MSRFDGRWYFSAVALLAGISLEKALESSMRLFLCFRGVLNGEGIKVLPFCSFLDLLNGDELGFVRFVLLWTSREKGSLLRFAFLGLLTARLNGEDNSVLSFGSFWA